MKNYKQYFLPVILIAIWLSMNPGTVHAQKVGADFRDAFNSYFNYSSDRIISLAKEMPESTYTWSPGEGVMSVARVYMHIARYNFYYLETSLGVPAPEDIDLETMEEITEKEKVVELLQRSIDHVKESLSQMSDTRLEEPTELYGRTVEGWEVLFQLISHKNEHLGQSIAYARTNGVVPPWSR